MPYRGETVARGLSPRRPGAGAARAGLAASLALRDAGVVPIELVVVAAIGVDIAIAAGELPGQLAPRGRVGEEQRGRVGAGPGTREGDGRRLGGVRPLRR